MHHPTDSPTIQAARLAGQRRAYLDCISDADLSHEIPEYRAIRAATLIGPDGLIDWASTPLPGSVAAYGRAALTLGGAA